MKSMISVFVVLVFSIELLAQTPTTSSTIDDSSVTFLKAQNRMLQASLDQRTKELVALQAEIKDLKTQIAGMSTGISPAPETAPLPTTQSAAAKRVVVSYVVSTLIHKPFVRMSVGQVGLISNFNVVSIISEDAMIVKVVYPPTESYDSSRDAPASGSAEVGAFGPPHVATEAEKAHTFVFMLEGAPTNGLAENKHVKTDLPLKIVRSADVDGKRYFVAWPVINVKDAAKVVKLVAE